jgi:PAS domain S-box-containing protein
MSSATSILSPATPLALPAEPSRRSAIEALYRAYENRVFAQTNRLFVWLLLIQWAFAIFVAVVWSPRTWAGTDSSIHPHLLAALILGGVLVSLPLALIRSLPHHWATRHVVAVAQLGFSALLIHLTGGRIETHFHVFGSLAFIALYRDWRVLPTATLVVAVDHLVRGIWYPQSVYGVPYVTTWRTGEHSAWVIFEVVVLLWGCFVSRREMWEICSRQDAHEQLLQSLEQRVRERTRELEAEIAARIQTAASLSRSEERYRTLVTKLPIGVFETAQDGRVLLANPYLLSLLGLPPDQDLSQINMGEGRFLAVQDRERFWGRLRTEGEVRGFEANFRTVRGETLDIVMNARHHVDATGAHVCEGTLEDVTPRKRAARELNKLHQQLITASRQAGMADVANGVLHNVGNVLTSVNVTVHDVLDRLRTSRLKHLRLVVQAFQRDPAQLAAYLTDDPKGRLMPEFLAKLETYLSEENQRLRGDVESLARHFEHIRQIIVTQQNSARLCGLTEIVAPMQLVDDALKLMTDSLGRHGITFERQAVEAPPVRADRHKVLQILVNLLKNAKDAILAHDVPQGRITVRVEPAAGDMVALSVQDNGPGIPPENLAKIFQHGFTTKENGHGFGLHSAVLAAREMHGDLKVANGPDGPGALFTLLLPCAKPERP